MSRVSYPFSLQYLAKMSAGRCEPDDVPDVGDGVGVREGAEDEDALLRRSRSAWRRRACLIGLTPALGVLQLRLRGLVDGDAERVQGRRSPPPPRSRGARRGPCLQLGVVLEDVERRHELVRERHLHDLRRVSLGGDQVHYPPLRRAGRPSCRPGGLPRRRSASPCLTDLASSRSDLTSISTSKCPALERIAPSFIDLTAE